MKTPSHNKWNAVKLVLLAAVLFTMAMWQGTLAGNGKIVYAIDVDLANMDPLNAIDPGSYAVFQHFYEGLVRMTMDGDIEPVLAESWSVSSDNVTWTFNLRKNVKFQDGTDFNAAAVKAHFDRMLDPKQPNKVAGTFEAIKEVSVASAYQVRFVLKRPYAPFLALLTSASASICSPTAVVKYGKDYPFHPIGTGPFVFKEWVAGDHTTMVRNENYWGKKPGVQEVVFKPVLEPSARVIMLETGQVDAANSIIPEEIARLNKNKNIIISKQPVLRGWFIGLNCLEKPFDNILVRKALNHAIDVEAITHEILRDTATPLTAPVNSRVYGYSRQADYEYDPIKAKNMLAEAGYKNGFECNLWVPASGAGFVPEVPVIIQAMLEQVGVKIKIVTFEMSAFIDNIIKNPEESKKSGKHMVMMGIGAGTGEAANIMKEFFHTISWAPAKLNRIFYSNKQVDKLLDEALGTFDVSMQKAVLANAQKLVWDDAPWIFLYEMMGVYGVSKNLTGLQWMPSNYIIFHTADKK